MTEGWLLQGAGTPTPSTTEPSFPVLPAPVLVAMAVVFAVALFAVVRMAVRARRSSARDGAPAVRDRMEAELVRRYAEGELDEGEFQRRLLELRRRRSPDRPVRPPTDDRGDDGGARPGTGAPDPG